jgi:hypothetical protein
MPRNTAGNGMRPREGDASLTPALLGVSLQIWAQVAASTPIAPSAPQLRKVLSEQAPAWSHVTLIWRFSSVYRFAVTF